MNTLVMEANHIEYQNSEFESEARLKYACNTKDVLTGWHMLSGNLVLEFVTHGGSDYKITVSPNEKD